MYPAAVIFDFDGVIVDTEPLHYRSFQKILEPLGLGFNWEDYVETYMGFDDRDAFTEAFKTSGKTLNAAQLASLIDDKANVFQQIVAEGVSAYPGVVSLITTLYHQGVPLAISSGALKSDILPILDILNIKHCFSQIITAEDVAQSKPDPASYCLACELLEKAYSERITARKQIVAIEDTPAGITSAKGAGITVIAVSNSYPQDKLTAADRIIDTLEVLQPGF